MLTFAASPFGEKALVESRPERLIDRRCEPLRGP